MNASPRNSQSTYRAPQNPPGFDTTFDEMEYLKFPIGARVYPCIEDCTSTSCHDGCSVSHCPPGCIPDCVNSGVCDSSDLCESIDCNDASCLETTPICLDGSCPYTFLDEVPSRAYLPAENTNDASLHCRWEAPGQSCNVSVSTPNALGQHVLHDHIEPQTTFTCPWDECAEVMGFQQLPSHLMHEHHPDRYICLWQDCKLSFKTHEALDAHIKFTHANLDCHWAGCEASAKDLSQLKTHFDTHHLNSGFDSNLLASSFPLEPVEMLSYGRNNLRLQAPPSVSINHFSTPKAPTPHPPVLHNYQLPITGADKHGIMEPFSASADEMPPSFGNIPEITSPVPLSSMKGSFRSLPINIGTVSVCEWMMEISPSRTCGMRFDDPLDLQSHVDRDHIWKTALGATSGEGMVCLWQNCKRNGKVFQNNDKLRRHLFIHTGCKYIISISIKLLSHTSLPIILVTSKTIGLQMLDIVAEI